jgi:outer membrane protein OmpA-like peptidoglycan-associated protein
MSPAARNLVVQRSPAPAGARLIGEIDAVAGKGCGASGEPGSEQAALDKLRVKAAGLDADYVMLKSVEAGTSSTACNEFHARGVAYDTHGVSLRIGGSDKFAASEPLASSTPAKLAPPPSADTKANLLPPPAGSPRYALGFDTPVAGCLKGFVYEQPADKKELGDDYAEAAPKGELWGCEWGFDGRKLADAVPKAEAGRSYAVRYQGTFQVANAGVFRFALASSSATRISIDGAEAITGAAGGKAGASEQALYLGGGRHQVLIEYLAAGDDLSLSIAVTLPQASAATPFSLRPSSPFSTEQGLDYTGPAGGNDDDWRKLVDVETEKLKLNGRVYFRTRSAELEQRDKTEEALLAVAKTMRERNNLSCVEIQGHTDDRGDARYNLKLSRERAEAVRDWLVQTGIEPHRLVAIGFGGAKPIAGNDSDAGRAGNRRVEFLLRAPDAKGVCPRPSGSSAGSAPARRPQHVAPDVAERACKQSAALRGKLLTQLAPWLSSHQSCQSDAECVPTLPLACHDKSKALDCAWVVVNKGSVDQLQSTGARLDSVAGYCAELPPDAEVRSCGSCPALPRRCVSGSCQGGPR